MADICPICFDDMDMKSYEDEQQSTTTCFKLECGHAFHTRCIINVLNHTGRKCPSCNQDKTPSDELTREGLVQVLIKDLKKVPSVKIAVNEVVESLRQYKESTKILKDDVKKYIEQRKVELGVTEKREYMLHSLKHVQMEVRTAAKHKGLKYLAAIKTINNPRQYNYWGGSPLEKLVFGRQMALKIARSKYLYFHLPVK
jgi:hypothetical protein